MAKIVLPKNFNAGNVSASRMNAAAATGEGSSDYGLQIEESSWQSNSGVYVTPNPDKRSQFIGSDGNDDITTGDLYDRIIADGNPLNAGLGNDRIHLGGHNDYANGGKGADTIWGESGNDCAFLGVA